MPDQPATPDAAIDDERPDDTSTTALPAPPLTSTTPEADQVELAEEHTLAVVDWISFVHLTAGVLLLVALLGFGRSTVDSLTKLVIGGVLALALDIPTRRLQDWKLPRGAAAAIVCLAALVGLVAVVVLLGPPAVEEASGFGDDLPATVAELEQFPVVGARGADADLAGRAERWLDSLPGSVTVESVSGAVDRLFATIASIVQVLLVTLALLLDGERLVSRARRLVPAHLRPRVDRAADLVYDTLGRYFAGSLFLAVMNGLYILAVGLLLGVPLIILAAVWEMITNLIPQIGGFLGGLVFVGLAVTAGALTGVIAAVAFVAYMSTENYVLSPAVVGKAVNLSPPTTMIAAIVGGTAAGVPGALVATPFVGSVKALYMAARHHDVRPTVHHAP